MNRVLLRFHPADRAVAAILSIAVLTAIAGWAAGRPLAGAAAVHALLLAGLGASALLLAVRERSRWVQFVRPAVTVAIVFTLYGSLGALGIAAMPRLADAPLARLDAFLFGGDPSLAIQPLQTPGRVELMSFVYGAFIPYINLSMVLGCLGRPPGERDRFLTGFIFTYTVSYLGYLFLPARGPVAFHAADYTVALHGGPFHRLVLGCVEASGGAQGAFPSLHVGASLYLCLFDLGTHRLRGLTYLPMVILIYGATVFLRYHYVVDLVAGTAVALFSLWAGPAAFSRWAALRDAAGLPSLPGSEGDVPSTLPGAGQAGARGLLPAH